METALQLFESPNINKIIRGEMKKIRKEKVETGTIMNSIHESLKDKYTITKFTTQELSIKVDKKMNILELEEEVKSIIDHHLLDKSVNRKLLFKTVAYTNELTIRVKRK